MITASDYDYRVQLTKFFLQIHSQQMQEIVHLSNSQLLFYRIYHPIFSIRRLPVLDQKHTCLANDLHGCPYRHYEYVLISPHFHCYGQPSFRL